MNMTRPLLALAGCLAMSPCFAEMDVDQADSLNFHEFHQDKKAAVKVWKERNEEQTDRPAETAPVKMYDQQSTSVAVEPQDNATGARLNPVSAGPQENSGKRFEIRERYTLTRSPATPYSAFYVIEALHQQMATLCPAGWQKLEERSEPVGGDFYLYYTLQCL